ncbi:MAG: MerR family transcriptional regulator [Anaerolineae bacterium]|nr:MerR family transcriptional regulator [Anaerolineae bacterium]
MKIAEVSELSGLSIDTLRYYERVGLLPPVHRNDSGIRDFDELDVRRVQFIKCMRQAGIPVDVLTEYMRLALIGDETFEARKNILEEQRDLLAAQIAEMQSTLDLLNYKINFYEERLAAVEKNLSPMEEFDVTTQ